MLIDDANTMITAIQAFARIDDDGNTFVVGKLVAFGTVRAKLAGIGGLAFATGRHLHFIRNAGAVLATIQILAGIRIDHDAFIAIGLVAVGAVIAIGTNVLHGTTIAVEASPVRITLARGRSAGLRDANPVPAIHAGTFASLGIETLTVKSASGKNHHKT